MMAVQYYTSHSSKMQNSSVQYLHSTLLLFPLEDVSPCCVPCSCITVQYNTVQCNAVSYSTLYCSTVQYNAVHYSTVQHITVQYSAEQCSAVQYSAVQYSAVQNSIEDQRAHPGLLPLPCRVSEGRVLLGSGEEGAVLGSGEEGAVSGTGEEAVRGGSGRSNEECAVELFMYLAKAYDVYHTNVL